MQILNKKQAHEIHGGLTQTTKMPCKSYSLPTIACKTGFKMRAIAGSICASCYAEKGNYKKYQNNIEPAQHARLESLNDDLWVDAMVVSIGADKYFRWHDSGDIQDIEHLEKIAAVARATPNCMHWLPTREYGIVSAFTAQYDIPKNLIIRLSAMFTDKPVVVPASLKNVAGIAVSNVHSKKPRHGMQRTKTEWRMSHVPCMLVTQSSSCILFHSLNNKERKIMRLIYSVAYTLYDAQARAHRQANTWVSGARHQALTRDGIERIVHRDHPRAIILQTQVFTDARFS